MRPIRPGARAHRHHHLLLVAAIAPLLMSLLAAPDALAVVTETSLQVTSPSGTYLLADEVTGADTIALAGSSNGSAGERLDINCYWGSSSAALARGVEIQSGGAFAYSGPFTAIAGHSCVLRAVPEGESTDHPPGTPTRFNGPLLALDLRYSETITKGPNVGRLASHYIFAAQTEGGFAYGSLGNCALMLSELYVPITFAEAPLDSCDGFLWWENGQEKAGFAKPTRSELQVDGRNAYLPGNVIDLFARSEDLPGFPAESYKLSVNPEDGDLTLEEADEVVACSPASSFPPTTEGCTSLLPTGVRAYLRVEQSGGGRQSRLTQYFESTDGKAHEVDLLEDNQFVAPTQAGELYLPWASSGFSSYGTPGQSLPAPPAGPGSLYLRAAPSEGPLGAITFAAAPEGETVVGATNGPSGVAWLDLHYHLLVPAAGYVALSFTYSNAFSIAEAQRMAQAAQAAYLPQVAIAAPLAGSDTGSETVTVAGSAADALGIASVSVNGQRVALSGGSWSTTLRLAPGPNTIDAIATNIFGNSSSAQTTITYTPPPPPGLALSAPAHPTRDGIAVTLSCNEPARVSCHGSERISARVLLRGNRAIAAGSQSARRHLSAGGRARKRIRAQTRGLGAVRFTISGGRSRTIVAPLSSYGRRLLRGLHQIVVTDLVTSTDAAGKGAAALTSATLRLRALDMRRVKRAITRALRRRGALRAAVRCPRFAIAAAGASFRCRVLGRAKRHHRGRRVPMQVAVRELGEDGAFSLVL
ncbi:MAG TPA: hypothetical protein VKU89_05330 [Solirubrobacteraceae bacterium]|nr:hypothetical protein [Solirubrobacteraceae bacterium]